MGKLQINTLSRINQSDVNQISNRLFDRKFGKRNDYVEFHVYDMAGN